MTIRFVLASASPARRETLMRAGVVPEVIVSHLDESAATADTPAELVQVLANAKAMSISTSLNHEAAVAGELPPETLVLGCDSLLELDGEALGKPGSTQDAIARWQRMRGRKGVLHTGHCLIDCAAGRSAIATVSTTVHFGDITDDEIEDYCSSGEPANVAGAFTIDGFGGWFIDAIEGDHHNVVGLSLPVLRRLLWELNFGLHDIGYPTP
ncbi:MAG: nucleoside triphosphate pyrophosphatase [Jatrophihabitantaceae bacterium]